MANVRTKSNAALDSGSNVVFVKFALTCHPLRYARAVKRGSSYPGIDRRGADLRKTTEISRFFA
jgi:hypothetical protein